MERTGGTRNKNKLKWNKRSKKVYRVCKYYKNREKVKGGKRKRDAKTRKEEERGEEEEEEKSKSNSPRKDRRRGWIGSRKRKTRKKEKQSTSHAAPAPSVAPFRCTPKTVPGTRSWSSWGHHMLSLYCIGICTYSRSDAGIPRICNVLPVFSITPFHHDFRKPCATYPLRIYLSVLSRYFFIGPLLYGPFLSLNIHIYAKVFEHSLLKY